MFELTVNGRTKKFESAAEMAEWMDRTKAIKPKPYRRRKKKAVGKSKDGLKGKMPRKSS